MRYRHFQELLELVNTKTDRKTVALVRAEDPHALEAVAEVTREGLVTPLLIGNREAIHQTAEQISFAITDDQILDAEAAATVTPASQAPLATASSPLIITRIFTHSFTFYFCDVFRCMMHRALIY